MPAITLLSWNVNGARAAARSGFLAWLAGAEADVVCLQETRADADQLPPEMREPPGYHAYWHGSAARKGYSGTALLTRVAPEAVQFGLGVPEFDNEGRTIIAHYSDFTLINCYFPNGGRDRSRVPYKLAFYDAFLAMCERLRAEGRQLVICGDVNTAHNEIDLARPKENMNTTGFLREERDWLDGFVAHGYVDTFRHRHPDLAGQYTWWLQWGGARERNIGWRIDYFFVAAEVLPRVVEACILPDVPGSDHCPVGLQLMAGDPRWQARGG